MTVYYIDTVKLSNDKPKYGSWTQMNAEKTDKINNIPSLNTSPKRLNACF